MKNTGLILFLALSSCATIKQKSDCELLIYVNESITNRRTSPSYYILRKSPQTYIHIQSIEHAIFGYWQQSGDTIFLMPQFYTESIHSYPLTVHKLPYYNSSRILEPSRALISIERMRFEDPPRTYFIANSSLSIGANNPKNTSIFVSKSENHNIGKTILTTPFAFLMCTSYDSAFYIGYTKNYPSWKDSIILSSITYDRKINKPETTPHRKNRTKNTRPKTTVQDSLFLYQTYRIRCDQSNSPYQIDTVRAYIKLNKTPYFWNRRKYRNPETKEIFMMQ